MTTDPERQKVYAATRQDLLSRQLSNSEHFDSAILTLSTGALGISLAFIKDIVPLGKAVYIVLLEISWWLFGLAIISTMLSFVASQLGIKKQLAHAEEYYLNEKEEFLNKKNLPAGFTEILNYTAGVLFIGGIIVTVLFVSLNMKGAQNMADNNPKHLQEGQSIPNLQKVASPKETKGATIPSLQPVKPAPQSGSNQSTSFGKK